MSTDETTNKETKDTKEEEFVVPSPTSAAGIRAMREQDTSVLAKTAANWDTWLWDMEMHLGSAGFWDYIKDSSTVIAPHPEYQPLASANFRANSNAARYFLIANVDPKEAQQYNLLAETTPYDLRARLEKIYAKPGPTLQLRLMERCFQTFLVNDTKMIENFDELMDTAFRSTTAVAPATANIADIVHVDSTTPDVAPDLLAHAIHIPYEGFAVFTAPDDTDALISPSPTAVPPPTVDPSNNLDYDEEEMYDHSASEPSPPPPPSLPVVETQPKRSTRLAEKSQSPPKTREEKLRSAVDESREVVEEARRARRERKRQKRLAAQQEKEHDKAFRSELNALLTSLGVSPSTISQHDIETDTLDTVRDPVCLSLDTEDDEPTTWKEADASSDGPKWRSAGDEEKQSLKSMKVYTLTKRSEVPKGAKILRSKPVFKKKRNENGEVVRYKVRFVVKGFEQVFGRDYQNTTSPTARMESWRILFHIAAALDWEMNQMDVKTAFLYGILPEDEIQYME
ncbi:hypothetical protein CVT24_001894 [Panaeolus cyanescens]|uniref:Reverse transcriptase Ty1/copia-type domain-containing protein n=1 Tax=Panaeolus cyanescens TaxID=181874 RepID=A0A409WUW4_9AGAR|nr:hypothetical protein CVT24_001894 [Panaeolus cyanescens]